MTQNKQAEWGRKWKADQQEEEEDEDEEGCRRGVEEPGGEDAEASDINRLYITTTYDASHVSDVKLEYDVSVFSSV